MKRYITTGIAGLSLVIFGACTGRSPNSTATATSQRPVAPVTAVSTAPAPTAITTPDLTDVDSALASVDAEITTAQREATNEGAPSQ